MSSPGRPRSAPCSHTAAPAATHTSASTSATKRGFHLFPRPLRREWVRVFIAQGFASTAVSVFPETSVSDGICRSRSKIS